MKSTGIVKLKLINFRSYESAEVEFSNLPAVIFGKNGVGKTNLLEAISLLYSGKGLRKSNFSRVSDGSKERFSKRVVIVDELNETKNLFFEVISDSSQDKF